MRRYWFRPRVRMVRCVAPEPVPPDDPNELEAWCESGNSGRPIQTHLGDSGRVLWMGSGGSFCVQFDDGDERYLYPDEITFVNPGMN